MPSSMVVTFNSRKRMARLTFFSLPINLKVVQWKKWAKFEWILFSEMIVDLPAIRSKTYSQNGNGIQWNTLVNALENFSGSVIGDWVLPSDKGVMVKLVVLVKPGKDALLLTANLFRIYRKHRIMKHSPFAQYSLFLKYLFIHHIFVPFLYLV